MCVITLLYNTVYDPEFNLDKQMQPDSGNKKAAATEQSPVKVLCIEIYSNGYLLFRNFLLNNLFLFLTYSFILQPNSLLSLSFILSISIFILSFIFFHRLSHHVSSGSGGCAYFLSYVRLCWGVF